MLFLIMMQKSKLIHKVLSPYKKKLTFHNVIIQVKCQVRIKAKINTTRKYFLKNVLISFPKFNDKK